MINKEAIEKLKKAIGVMPHITHKENGDDIYCLVSEALALLKEQPPASELTKECRKIVKDWGCLDGKESNDLCDRLDASEASRKELLAACEVAQKRLVECSKVFLGTGDTPESEDMANAICDVDAAIKKHKQGD